MGLRKTTSLFCGAGNPAYALSLVFLTNAICGSDLHCRLTPFNPPLFSREGFTLKGFTLKGNGGEFSSLLFVTDALVMNQSGSYLVRDVL